MAIITRKIVTYLKNIKDLADTPNKDGLSADDLKAFFDGRGDAEIKDAINGIVDDLTAIADGSSGADQIGATALKVGGATTVQGQLEETQATLNTKLNNSGSKNIDGETVFSGNVYIENNVNSGRIAFGTSGTLLQNSSDADGLAINDKKIATQEYTDAVKSALDTHVAKTDNPHSVTKTQVGLSNVDNTSDANKPVSSSQQTALNLKVDKVTGKSLSTNDYDNTEKASVASNAAARHSHANKATLDAYSQTEADLSDAVAKKHAHANKTVIDGISEVTTVLGSTTNKVPSEKAVADAISFAGGGDMLKAVYDTTGNGTVDNAELVNGLAVLKAVPANAIFTDTVYTHPTTAGNKHVPTGGAANQILKYSASGTAVWGDPAAGVTIVNNLTETVTGKVLDATQGKNLSDIVSTKLTKFVGTTAGTSTVLTATITDATLADYTNIQIRLHADLGASATLNLNGLGAKPIYTSGNVAVGTGALTGSMLNLMYNSTLARWYLLDILSAPSAYTANMVKFFSIPSKSGQIRLKIEKPTDSTGAMLRYKTTAWVSGDTRATGTLIASITDDSNYKGINQWYEITGLTNGTTYYVKAFPYLDTQYNETIGVNETVCTAGGLLCEISGDSISGSTVNDTSGNSNNGTLNSITTRTGLVGNELTATGTNQYVDLPTSMGQNSTTAQSIICWIKLTSLPTGTKRLIYMKNYGAHIRLYVELDGTLSIYNGTNWYNTTITISTNVRYLVAVKWNGSNALTVKVKATTDSAWSNSTPVTSVTNTTSVIYLFGDAISDLAIAGSGIDQWRYYSRLTTDGEDDNLFNGGVGC